MEDKLVTLAIHTFEKAQILKRCLKQRGLKFTYTCEPNPTGSFGWCTCAN